MLDLIYSLNGELNEAEKKKSFRGTKKLHAIMKQYLVARVPVLDLCDEYSLKPTFFTGGRRNFLNTVLQLLIVSMPIK